MEEMLSPKSEDSGWAEELSSWNTRLHRHDNSSDCGQSALACVRCSTGVGELVVLVLFPERRLGWEQMLGRRLSADLGPLQDINHMTQQSSDVRQEEFLVFHWQKNRRETHLFCGTAPAVLLSAAHRHIRQVVFKPRLQCRDVWFWLVSTCWDFTDHFGIFLELDVVITLKLQQHHLQVDVITHLKPPHCPVSLPVQGCCRGNVAKESETVSNAGRQSEHPYDLDE